MSSPEVVGQQNHQHHEDQQGRKKKGLWSRLKRKFHPKPNIDVETLFPGLFGRALSGNPSGSSGTGTLIATLPHRVEEQRQLACSLLSELDEYERLQTRGGTMYRSLPPLRFHVRVVRNVNGQEQRLHNVLNAAQLRQKLVQILSVAQTNNGHHPQNLFADVLTAGAPTASAPKRCVKNIEIYPSYKYDGTHLPEDKNMCVICQSEFEANEEIKFIPCLHFFHKECIDEWMNRSCVCPICKSKIECQQ